MSFAWCLWAGAVQAAELVPVVAASWDGRDRFEHGETAGFGPGPHLGLALGVGPEDAPARLQVGLELQGGAGWDRIEWVDDDTRYYDLDHLAVAWSARLLVGPSVEVPVPDSLPVTPTVHLGVGGGRVWTHHSFGDATGPLMDPEQNDLDSPTNLDPYTAQWVTAAGGALGLRVDLPVLDVDLVFEVGYTVSFVPAAPVRKTLSEFQVERAEYGLNVARVGLGLAIPL